MDSIDKIFGAVKTITSKNDNLLQRTERFPLIITEKLEKKIRFLCNKFPSNEWSGHLFYRYEGSFKDNNIKFIAEDLYFMNIGSSAATEFDTSDGNVAAYMCDHDLFGCQLGLIHSHNSMNAFFSGVDDTALYQEGCARNHFLSLVVNNDGKYVARITLKKIITSIIQNTVEGKTFNDESIEFPSYEDITEKTVVEMFDLDIKNDFKFLCDDVEELEERIEETKKEKAINDAKSTPSYPYYQRGYGFGYGRDYDEDEGHLFPGAYTPATPAKPASTVGDDKDDDPFIAGEGVYTRESFVLDKLGQLDKDLVANYCKQIVTLNFAYDGKPDIYAFVAKMDKHMNKRFEDLFSYRQAAAAMIDTIWEEIMSSVEDDNHEALTMDDYVIIIQQFTDYIVKTLKVPTKYSDILSELLTNCI